jgi:hypothetical protein
MPVKTASSRPARRRRFILPLALAAAIPGPAFLAAPSAIVRGDAAADRDLLRQQWEAVITLYGEEETGRYSLRVLDPDVKSAVDFVFVSFWKYNRETNQWDKIKEGPSRVKVVLPKDKPKDGPRDSQLLAELPLTIKDSGIFYAKWTVNGVPGATFSMLGRRAKERAPVVAKKGEIIADVPIDLTKSEVRAIPDPAIALKDR